MKLSPLTVIPGMRAGANLVGLLLALTSSAAPEVAAPRVLHQYELQGPEPDGRRPLVVNPPTFRWPAFGEAPYTVELGGQPDLADARAEPPVKETFWRRPAPLAPGRYWWRVTDAKGARQPVVSFEVLAETPCWEIPPWAELRSRLPAGRPRLLMRPEDLPRLRELARGEMKPLVDNWRRAAGRVIGREFADERKAAKSIEPDADGLVMKAQHAARDYAGDIAGPLDQLALVYLLTGDTAVRDELRRRALAAAAIDPDGLTSNERSDFANETIAVGLAWAYDALHAEWTPRERTAVREALVARTRQGFEGLRPREQQLFHAHAWQHVLQSMTLAALALYDEAPEAAGWFEWGFKMYVAHHPWYGGADGGSAEGLGYYLGHELAPTLRATAMFEAATGVSFFAHPWLRQTPYFLLYGLGLGDANSQYGDASGAKSAGPKEKSLMRIMAGRLGDGHVAAYADAIDAGSRFDENDILRLLWHPLPQPAPKPLAQLPKARAFRDTGLVYLRSDLAEPARDIFFEFRSSPYGGFGHAHSDQNSFNLTAFGERLIVDSGYYYAANDKHRNGWSKRTIAHNSILVGGTGQSSGSRDVRGWGQIVGFEEGSGFVRLTGAAASAYLERPVTRFDRHVLWLQPDTYVIADELETPEPQTFQWLLHSPQEMQVRDRVVQFRNGDAAARLEFLHGPALDFTQTDRFPVPVVMWRRDAQDASKYPNQWHLTGSTRAAATKARFVSVLQVFRAGDETKLPRATVDVSERGVSVKLSDGRAGLIAWR